MEVSVGIKVAARGLEWDVTEVEPLGPQQRLRLACACGDLQGLEWDVLYPAEPVAILRTDPRPEEAGSLEDWRRYHTAWLLDQIPGVPVLPAGWSSRPISVCRCCGPWRWCGRACCWLTASAWARQSRPD